MKSKTFLLLIFAAGLAMLAPRPAEARANISFSFFYDQLSPYGEWVDVGDYGNCWRPTGVDADWTPYSDGYWSFTDAGWTWVSYEDFGGIVYHYGRWVRVEDEGWCWKPDVEWAPAWVSWRHSDDYVGWAPLPPECRFRREVGFSTWVDNEYDIGPASYSFCRVHDFGAPVLRPVILNRFENVKIINRTVNITNITYNNSVVYNGGPDYRAINQRVQRPIPALKLVRNTNVNITNIKNVQRINVNSVQRGNQLTVVSPVITAPTVEQQRILRPKATRIVTQDKVNRGWANIKDPEERRLVKEKYQQDTNGLTPATAPAKPVQVADLKLVPAKADPNARPAMATLRPKKEKNAPGAEIVAAPANPTNEPAAAGAGNVPAAGNDATAATPRGKKPAPADREARPKNPTGTPPADAVAATQPGEPKAGKERKIAKEVPDAAAVDAAAPESGAPAGKNRKGAVQKPAPLQADPAVAQRDAETQQREQQAQQEQAAERRKELADQRKENTPKAKQNIPPTTADAADGAAVVEAARSKQEQAARAREERTNALREKQAQLQQNAAEAKQRRQQEAAANEERRQQTVAAKPKPQGDRGAALEETRQRAERQQAASQATEARRAQADRAAADDDARQLQAGRAARQQQAAQQAQAQQRQLQTERAQNAQREQGNRQQQAAAQQQQAQAQRQIMAERAAQAAQQRAAQPRQAPPSAPAAAAARKGKGKLTPEEAAALQQGR